MSLILYFLSAILLTNGIPHFAKGITGEKHTTPFKRPSSAVVNVLWGTLNLYVGSWLLYAAVSSGNEQFLFASSVFFAGVMLTVVPLAHYWSHDTQARAH